MNQEEIKQNEATFKAYCHEYIKREGIDALLAYLDNTDFFIAPSSSNYHLNEPGGLCRHSINVFETAKSIYDNIVSPKINDGTSPFSEGVTNESIAISALLHDLCKTKIYKPAERWKKDEHGRWMSYPGYEIADDFPFGHGEKSCLIIGWFMRLKQEELLAIRWHMGMFEMTENGTSTRFAYRAAMEKSPLVSLLQAADMLSANCMEKTTTY